MIDIGLTKIALIGIVALVVIGPEQLPRVARMAGSLLGRAQRYINEVKSEVSREMALDELRKMHQDVQEAASHVEQSIAQNLAEVKSATNLEPLTESAIERPIHEQQSVKAKNFRKRKLAKTSAIPAWFKHQTGRRTRVISGAARMVRYRPSLSRVPNGSFF